MMIYLPVGKTVKISTSHLPSKKIIAWWFNPKNEETRRIGKLTNKGIHTFTSPTVGNGNDWVLVIDNDEGK